jgi:hypothetical protein
MNPHLRILESADGWRVEHAPSGERLGIFRTQGAAEKFRDEIAPLDWSFKDPLRVPMATWAGLIAALGRRGILVEPKWELLEGAEHG